MVTNVRGQGQQGSGSPYSAYGLGEFLGNNQVSQAMMGGAGIAIADPFSTNQVNPASYAALGLPVFETGTSTRFRNFAKEGEWVRGSRTDLLGLSLGLPFGRGRWGLAIGVNPVTQVGYLVRQQEPIPGGTGEVTFEYTGEGGLNRAYAGLAHRIWTGRDSTRAASDLAFGANVNYQFGSVDEIRKAYYPINQGYYNTAAVSELVLRAPMVSTGIQFTGTLMNEEKLKAGRDRRAAREAAAIPAEADTLGVEPSGRKSPTTKTPSRHRGEDLRYRLGITADLPADLSARRDVVTYSFIRNLSGVELPVDTIDEHTRSGVEGRLGIPIQLGLGAAVFNARWMVTAEYRLRDWNDIRVDVEDLDLGSRLARTASAVLGATYRPAGGGNGTFFQNTIYRAGFRYTDDYLVVGDEQLREIGMSFGLSLPLLGSMTRSRFNLGAEFGEQGSAGGGVIKEQFAHLLFGISITPELRDKSNWLKKRRIE